MEKDANQVRRDIDKSLKNITELLLEMREKICYEDRGKKKTYDREKNEIRQEYRPYNRPY